jgi:hypothetical protein
MENTTLTALNLANNSVTSVAAAVLANGLTQNTVLVTLELSGNPLGKQGVTVLFNSCNRSPVKFQRQVNMSGCNTVKGGQLFDFDEPSGDHVFDMEDPYHRYIAEELLSRASAFAGHAISSLEHQPDPLKIQRVKVDLQKNPQCKENVYNDGDPANMPSGKNFAALVRDKMPLIKNLRGLVRKGSAIEVGTTGFSGLVESVVPKSTRRWSTLRVHSPQVSAAMETSFDLKARLDATRLLDENRSAYTIPSYGILHMTFTRKICRPSDFQLVNHTGLNVLKSQLESKEMPDSQKIAMLTEGFSGSHILTFQAQELIDTVSSAGLKLATADMVKLLSKMVLLVADVGRSIHLARANLCERGMRMLANRLGDMFFILMGNPSGYYKLDLSSPEDRRVAQKLMSLSNHRKHVMRTQKEADTSQKGDGSSFRNESFESDGWEDFKMDDHFFKKLPRKGKLCFDFVQTARPNRMTVESDFHEVERHLDGFVDFKGKSFTAWTKLWAIEEALFLIRIAFCSKWVTVAEVLPLIVMFPQKHPDSKCRLEAAVSVFSRIIDLENFGEIQNELTLEDKQELGKRLGMLNVFMPFSIDRKFDLNLAIHEERMIATVLVHLAQEEPGENWQDETFGWDYGQADVLGWQLPLHWTEDDGNNTPTRGDATLPFCQFSLTQLLIDTITTITATGHLMLVYCSRKEKGCCPNWITRIEMVKRTLVGHEYGPLLKRSLIPHPEKIEKMGRSLVLLTWRVLGDSFLVWRSATHPGEDEGGGS